MLKQKIAEVEQNFNLDTDEFIYTQALLGEILTFWQVHEKRRDALFEVLNDEKIVISFERINAVDFYAANGSTEQVIFYIGAFLGTLEALLILEEAVIAELPWQTFKKNTLQRIWLAQIFSPEDFSSLQKQIQPPRDKKDLKI